jgi:hypothetical protein
MLALQILLVMILLIVCGFAPGFFLVRRLRMSPMEKLCGSIGLSLILLYLVTWEYFCLVPDAGVVAYAAVPAVSLALGFLARRDFATFLRSPRVRRALLGYSFLFVWTVLILCMIRVYSGAGWSGDWAEHFQRTLFFLHRFPAQTPIIGGYQLPARPPLMNVLAAFFLAQTQDLFEIFQVVFTFLNLLMFLPCCLLMRALGARRRQNALPLAALFAVSPVVMQAVTYTWPRGMTAFFVVTGIAFYLAGWRKNDSLRMAGAFVFLSAGLLAHYSAGPYAVFAGLHYAICLFRKRAHRWRELAVMAASCTLLLSTWFGWSVSQYGTHATVASNTTITYSQAYGGSTAGKVAVNIYHSIVPAVVRDWSSVNFFGQRSRLGFLSDNAFIFYESNVIFSMGLAGGAFVLWLLYRNWRTGGARSGEQRFWMALIPFCVVVGIAVVGEADHFGVAHVTLLPLEIMGITMLAGALPLRRLAMMVLVTGCVVDLSLGVLLHVRAESFEVGTASDPFSLSVYAQGNWQQKHPYDTRSGAGIEAAAGNDDLSWQGWYRRHGGSMTYLGDHLASLSFDGNGGLQMVLLLLFGGLLWRLWR